MIFTLYRLVYGEEVFNQNWLDLFGVMMGEGHTNHSLLKMWDGMWRNLSFGYLALKEELVTILLASTVIASLMLAFRLSRLIVYSLSLAGVSLAILSGLAVHYFILNIYPFPEYGYPIFYYLYAVIGPLVCLTGLLFYHQKAPLLSTVSGMALVIFVAMSLGSDMGIQHYLYYSHFSFAVTLGLLHKFWLSSWQWVSRRFTRVEPNQAPRALIASNILLGFLVTLSFLQLSNPQISRPIWDAPYNQTTHKVEDVEVLAGMRTNDVRAAALRRISVALKPFEDQKLVIHNQCPTCYSVTNALPYFKTVWIDLRALTGWDFIAELNKGAREGRLPVVLEIIGTFDPWRITWKDEHKAELLSNFLKDQNYVLYNDGGYFQLYLPPQLASEISDQNKKMGIGIIESKF